MRVALIDSDTILWVACYYNKDRNDTEAMLADLDNFLESVLIDVKADLYAGYLQGAVKSSRHTCFPDYKGKRPPPPSWLVKNRPIVREHLIDKWKFEFVDGMEVDDAIASASWLIEDMDERVECKTTCHTTIVCSVDKDLKQIPGWNYNTKSKKLVYITEDDAVEHLCMQLLHGDVTDNIPNVRKGVGPAKASKILNDSEGLTHGMPSRVLREFMYEHGVFDGLIKFAENVLKATLKNKEPNFKVVLHEVPKTIKQKYDDGSMVDTGNIRSGDGPGSENNDSNTGDLLDGNLDRP